MLSETRIMIRSKKEKKGSHKIWSTKIHIQSLKSSILRNEYITFFVEREIVTGLMQET